MHTGIFVFAQIAQFLPQRQFRRIVSNYKDRTIGWFMSHWNQMSRKHGGEKYVKSFDGWTHLVVMPYAVIMRFDSLREIETSIDSTTVSLFSNAIFKGVGRHPKSVTDKQG